MSRIANSVRAFFGRGRATGGAVQGPAHSDDSGLVQLSPWFVSYDGGATWQESTVKEEP